MTNKQQHQQWESELPRPHGTLPGSPCAQDPGCALGADPQVTSTSDQAEPCGTLTLPFLPTALLRAVLPAL